MFARVPRWESDCTTCGTLAPDHSQTLWQHASHTLRRGEKIISICATTKKDPRESAQSCDKLHNVHFNAILFMILMNLPLMNVCVVAGQAQAMGRPLSLCFSTQITGLD